MNERKVRKQLEKFGPEMEREFETALANLLDWFRSQGKSEEELTEKEKELRSFRRHEPKR